MVHGQLTGQLFFCLEYLVIPDLSHGSCIGEDEHRSGAPDDINDPGKQAQSNMTRPGQQVHLFGQYRVNSDLLFDITPHHSGLIRRHLCTYQYFHCFHQVADGSRYTPGTNGWRQGS